MTAARRPITVVDDPWICAASPSAGDGVRIGVPGMWQPIPSVASTGCLSPFSVLSLCETAGPGADGLLEDFDGTGTPA